MHFYKGYLGKIRKYKKCYNSTQKIYKSYRKVQNSLNKKTYMLTCLNIYNWLRLLILFRAGQPNTCLHVTYQYTGNLIYYILYSFLRPELDFGTIVMPQLTCTGLSAHVLRLKFTSYSHWWGPAWRPVPRW